MKKNSRIYIAGHNGMVGSAILRKLKNEGYDNIVSRSSSELNLIDQMAVSKFFNLEKPEYVFMAAAKVGGILANNTLRAQFAYENMMIQNNVIHHSYLNGVKKLLFLGSSSIYPKMAPQPMKEEYLMSGPLEVTNEPYAIAKITGVKMCEAYRAQYGCNFISALATNLYGINDKYELKSSHVLPALLRKVHEAKENESSSVEIWGTGSPRREFLFVDDLSDALLYLMLNYNEKDTINVGSGIDVSIKELALLIGTVVGYKGELYFDTSKPDGPMRKLLDSSKLDTAGWKSSIALEDGIRKAYGWYLDNFCKQNDD